MFKKGLFVQGICISKIYWVLEGSLAGFFGCRETALESVCRADFSWKLDVRGGPRRSRGVPGVGFGRKSKENRAENLQPDCLQVPRNIENGHETALGLRG